MFLAATGASALMLPELLRAQMHRNPFTLGIASGSPRETSVVLWTRLAPEPLRGGGMPPGDVEVGYRVCADAAMRRTVRTGKALAQERYAHSVHQLVQGLEPGREYWYQFTLGDYQTAVGRTRTADRRSKTAKLVVASCQNWQSGYFAAYADIAAWAPDCVVHVGDYIYEGGVGTLGPSTREVDGETLRFNTVRLHNSPEIVTLWDYRNRHALYRSDPSLQRAHATSPWIMAMDDHEIDNNWVGDTAQDPWAQTGLEFKVRKLAALQAYYEHMPLERPPQVVGLDALLPMHDRFRIGPAQIHLLDTRQFRSDQACGDGRQPLSCAELAQPTRDVLGAAQERWLLESLAQSDASFNVLASQMWFSPLVYEDGSVNMDSWDGYPLARQRIVDAMASGVARPVVISGDWHCAAAMRIHADPMDARSRPVGYEFAGPAISSDCPWVGSVERAQAQNPHVRYVNGRQRGYARFTLDRNSWTTEYRMVSDVADPNAAVATVQALRLDDF